MMDWRSQQLPTPWELLTCPFDWALAWRTAVVWIGIVVAAQIIPLVLVWLLVHQPVLMRLFV